FEVLVGGGLGRQPIIGQTVREFLPLPDLLSYLEAILRVYNQYGRRDNIHKARIKVLVKALGIDKFREEVEAEWRASAATAPHLPQEEVDRIRAFFTPPAYEALEDIEQDSGDAQYKAWYRYNTRAHKIPGYRVVFVSLKAHGAVPGDMTSEQ